MSCGVCKDAYFINPKENEKRNKEKKKTDVIKNKK